MLMQVRSVLDCAADLTASTLQQAAVRGDRVTFKRALTAARQIYKENKA